MDGGSVAHVVVYAVPAGVQTGHEGRARGAAVRRRRICLREANPLRRQPVGIGREARVIRCQHVGLFLVGHEDEDIGTCGHAGRFLIGRYDLGQLNKPATMSMLAAV